MRFNFLSVACVMGGCAPAAAKQTGVARPDGVHWQLNQLSSHDGAIFLTSVDAVRA